MKLLIVDGKAERAAELKQLLEAGNEVEAASSWRSALAALNAPGPCVVLAAASRPAYRAVHRIRKDPRHGDPVRIVMYGDEGDRATLEAHAGLRARADRYVILPMHGQDLAELISEVASSPARAPAQGHRVALPLSEVELVALLVMVTSLIAGWLDLGSTGKQWANWGQIGGASGLLVSGLVSTARKRRTRSERLRNGLPLQPKSW